MLEDIIKGIYDEQGGNHKIKGMVQEGVLKGRGGAKGGHYKREDCAQGGYD